MNAGLIKKLFLLISKKVSFGFAIVTFTLFSAWIAAGYAYTFIYAAITFSAGETDFLVVVLGVGLVVATVIHAVHFGLLHRLGLSGFSEEIRLLNRTLAEFERHGPGAVAIPRLIDSLYSVPRQNFLFSALYSLVFVVIAAALYYLKSGNAMNVALMTISGIAACLIYGYSSFTISEYFTGPLRTSLERQNYAERGDWRSRYFLSVRIKTLFAILLVLLSMVLLVITLKRTSDAIRTTLFMGESVFTIGILIALLGNSLTLSLKRINGSTAALARGESGFFFPYFTERELVDFSRNYNKAAHEIAELRHHLQAKVDERTEELRAAMEEMEAVNENLIESNNALENARRIAEFDMKIAANLQSSLYPVAAPVTRGWDIAFTSQPKAGVSGDLFDFYTDGETLHGVALFDVSGHGVAAGLITMIARTIIRRHFMGGLGQNLAQVVDDINRELMEEIGNSDFYLSGVLLRIRDDQVEYVNAAHPDIFLKRQGQSHRIAPASSDQTFRGFFLGCRDMERKAKVLRFKVNQGDAVLLFTDCIFEGKNGEGEQYDNNGLDESVSASTGASSGEILKEIIRDYRTFIGRDRYDDDLTAIVMIKN